MTLFSSFCVFLKTTIFWLVLSVRALTLFLRYNNTKVYHFEYKYCIHCICFKPL